MAQHGGALLSRHHHREAAKRRLFRSVPELTQAIDNYIKHHNKNPKPFIWTAQTKEILEKVIPANRRLSSKRNAAPH
jgi:hypothetical protein